MRAFAGIMTIAVIAVPVASAAKPQPSTPPGSGGKALVARLSGANEVPPANAADRGNAVVRLNAKTLKVCWSFSAQKLTSKSGAATAPVAAHIHTGAAGIAGPVLVGFGATYSRRGCVTSTAETIAAILANPKGFYVNVHNASYPGGAIRGQLKRGAPA